MLKAVQTPANKSENKKQNSGQVAEMVQVLSKALVKLNISSTATQTEPSSAEKSTQTNKPATGGEGTTEEK